MYPIPSKININFKLEQNSERIHEVLIFDLTRQVVYQEVNVQDNSLMINLSHLNSGQYMFQLTTGANNAASTINGRFLIE